MKIETMMNQAAPIIELIVMVSSTFIVHGCLVLKQRYDLILSATLLKDKFSVAKNGYQTLTVVHSSIGRYSQHNA